MHALMGCFLLLKFRAVVPCQVGIQRVNLFCGKAGAQDVFARGGRQIDGPQIRARFHAREREYRYFIEPRKNPFTRDATWQYYVPLDMERMNEAAASLLEYDDFTSFAKLNSNNKTNICRIMHAAWTADERGVLCFTIRADRFLRNMVRSLVGTLVDVGRGRYTPDGFREIVGSRDLSRSSGGAPAQGLFLSDVVYPPGVFERKTFY